MRGIAAIAYDRSPTYGMNEGIPAHVAEDIAALKKKFERLERLRRRTKSRRPRA